MIETKTGNNAKHTSQLWVLPFLSYGWWKHKNQIGGVWYTHSNTHFLFLNNITIIFINFFTYTYFHTYFQTTKHIFSNNKTHIFKHMYQTHVFDLYPYLVAFFFFLLSALCFAFPPPPPAGTILFIFVLFVVWLLLFNEINVLGCVLLIHMLYD